MTDAQQSKQPDLDVPAPVVEVVTARHGRCVRDDLSCTEHDLAWYPKGAAGCHRFMAYAWAVLSGMNSPAAAGLGSAPDALDEVAEALAVPAVMWFGTGAPVSVLVVPDDYRTMIPLVEWLRLRAEGARLAAGVAVASRKER